MKEEVKKERPVGTIVFSIIQLVFSVLTLIVKVLVIFAAVAVIWMASFLTSPDYANLPNNNLTVVSTITGQQVTESIRVSGIYSIIFNSVFLLLIGLLGLIASIGALVKRNWGRKMLIFVAVLAIILNLLNLVLGSFISLAYPTSNGNDIQTISTTFSLALSAFWIILKCIYYVVLIVYFSNKKVKDYYLTP